MPKVKQTQKQKRVPLLPPRTALKSAKRYFWESDEEGTSIKSTYLSENCSVPSPSQNLHHTHFQHMPVQKLHVKVTPFVDYCIPRKVFQAIVKDIAKDYLGSNCRFMKEALGALQHAAEDYLIGFFEDALKALEHRDGATLMQKDLHLIARLRQIDYNPF